MVENREVSGILVLQYFFYHLNPPIFTESAMARLGKLQLFLGWKLPYWMWNADVSLVAHTQELTPTTFYTLKALVHVSYAHASSLPILRSTAPTTYKRSRWTQLRESCQSLECSTCKLIHSARNEGRLRVLDRAASGSQRRDLESLTLATLIHIKSLANLHWLVDRWIRRFQSWSRCTYGQSLWIKIITYLNILVFGLSRKTHRANLIKRKESEPLKILSA